MKKGLAMNMARTLKAPGDRTLNRLIVGSVLVLAIGIPLIAVIYFFDQYRDPGPSLSDRAIQAAEEAVRQNPNSINVRFTLAELYAGQARYPEAIVQYDEILKVQPDATGALLARGKAQVGLGKPDAAAADFQKVIDGLKNGEMAHVDQQLEAAYYNLGAVELKRGRSKEAVDLLARAVNINRTDADALYLLGTALIQSGDAETGIEALNRSIELVPTGWCDPYSELAQAYAAQKDTAGAQYATGMVASCQGRPAEAKAQLEPLTAGPYALKALIGLGLLAEEQGDTAAAMDAYTKALAVDPKNFAAVTGLGRVNGGTDTEAASPSPSAAGGG
jgi:tetratricopeptide (TPR) repeat protein